MRGAAAGNRQRLEDADEPAAQETAGKVLGGNEDLAARPALADAHQTRRNDFDAHRRQVEQRVGLPDVPIYITYLTVMPENGRIAFRGDVYGRDSHNRLASAN